MGRRLTEARTGEPMIAASFLRRLRRDGDDAILMIGWLLFVEKWELDA